MAGDHALYEPIGGGQLHNMPTTIRIVSVWTSRRIKKATSVAETALQTAAASSPRSSRIGAPRLTLPRQALASVRNRPASACRAASRTGRWQPMKHAADARVAPLHVPPSVGIPACRTRAAIAGKRCRRCFGASGIGQPPRPSAHPGLSFGRFTIWFPGPRPQIPLYGCLAEA